VDDRERQRRRLVGRVRRHKDEIAQLRRDVESYNDNHLPAGESRIDWDPDGEMTRCDAALDRMLAELGEAEPPLDRRGEGA
jgi:hypothetical protein